MSAVRTTRLRLHILATLGLGGAAAGCCPSPDYSDVPPQAVALSDSCEVTVNGGEQLIENCSVFDGDVACPDVSETTLYGDEPAVCLSGRALETNFPQGTGGLGGGGQSAVGGSGPGGSGGSGVGGSGAGGSGAGGSGPGGGGGEAGMGGAGGARPATVRTRCCYGYITDVDQGGCGRPYLIAGEAVVAPVRERGDWLMAGEGPTQEPPLAWRAELAERWLRDAQMEHASIAAFARFTTDLIRVGAPTELVIASVRAMRDEQDHARRCFTLASRFAGEPIGPAELPLPSPEADDLVAIALRTLSEGCVGETVAALDAAETLPLVQDAEARDTLARIAEDEARHAALAFRFLAWAARDEAVRQALIQALPELEAAAAGVTTPAIDDPLRAFGQGPSHRPDIAAQAIGEVVLPCLRALLTRPAARVTAGSRPRDLALM